MEHFDLTLPLFGAVCISDVTGYDGEREITLNDAHSPCVLRAMGRERVLETLTWLNGHEGWPETEWPTP